MQETPVMSLVCGHSDRKPIRVERSLIGEQPFAFPPLEIGEGCTQLRDVIPRHVLGDGVYRYAIVGYSSGQEVARTEQLFEVAPLRQPTVDPVATMAKPC